MNRLIYFGDPMCSWCYGFAPEVDNILNAFNGKLPIEIVMGGLRPYNTERMSEMKDFLTKHWVKVADASGQKFTYDILDSDLFYDTEPSSRAVVAVKSMKPELVWDYYKATHHVFYEHGQDPNDMATFSKLAVDFDLDQAEFERLFQSEETKQATRDEFAGAKEMGVAGFPTLVLETEDKMYLISRGYQKAHAIVEVIKDNLPADFAV